MCLLYGVAGCSLFRGCLSIEVNGKTCSRDFQKCHYISSIEGFPLYTYLHNLPWGNWISRGLWVAASTTERAMVPTITLLEIKAVMIAIVHFMPTGL